MSGLLGIWVGGSLGWSRKIRGIRMAVAREVVMRCWLSSGHEKPSSVKRQPKHWNRAPVITQVLQLVASTLFTTAAFIAGRGGIP